MNRFFTSVAGLLAGLSVGTAAQPLLLSNAVVHTVSGPDLSPGQVLVRDGRIEAVGTNLVAAGAQVIDLEGRHLYPGMIALNTTLGLLEISAVRATRDTTEVGDYTPEVQSWIAVNPDSELLPVARANGVTHFQPTPHGGIVAGQSSLLSLDGWTTADMIVKGTTAMHLYWPSMNLDTTPKEKAKDKSKWKSLEEQEKDRRVRLKAIDDFFDEAQAYATVRERGSKEGRGAQEIIPAWEAMLPLLRGDMPLMIHADEERQIRAAVEWAGRRGIKAVLMGGRDAWRLASFLSTHKVPVVYDDVFTLPPRDSDSYDVQYAAPRILGRSRVMTAFSPGANRSDGSLVKNLPYEAAQAAAHGLPRAEALKAVTLYPAMILGVENRLGSIEPGKEASLFVADGDILDIRSNVHRMWIAGREVSLESRHTRLYEKYKNRPAPAGQ